MNDNHDEQGRFASAEGVAAFKLTADAKTLSVATQPQVDALIDAHIAAGNAHAAAAGNYEQTVIDDPRLNEARAKFNAASAKYKVIQKQFRNGEVTADKFVAAQKEYKVAEASSDVEENAARERMSEHPTVKLAEIHRQNANAHFDAAEELRGTDLHPKEKSIYEQERELVGNHTRAPQHEFAMFSTKRRKRK